MQKAYLNPTPDQTFEIVGEGPYNFTRVLAHTRELEAAGNVEDACNERYQAFQRLAGLLPEDEEINLEWSHRNSQSALELIRASAIDHFLINDFEMSAALLEMLLELDPEDHLEGSELLAFDYLAMDEQELFDEVINDVSDKCASRGILLLWSAFRREGTLPEGVCTFLPGIYGRRAPCRRCLPAGYRGRTSLRAGAGARTLVADREPVGIVARVYRCAAGCAVGRRCVRYSSQASAGRGCCRLRSA